MESGNGEVVAGVAVNRTETRVWEKFSSYAAWLPGVPGNGEGGTGVDGLDGVVGNEGDGASEPSSGRIEASSTLQPEVSE
jgi:hypothetical protein